MTGAVLRLPFTVGDKTAWDCARGEGIVHAEKRKGVESCVGAARGREGLRMEQGGWLVSHSFRVLNRSWMDAVLWEGGASLIHS